MAQTFGDLFELLAGDGEYLKIGFHPSSIPLQQRWRNNGLSADFLADYLSTFFPGEDLASAGRQSKIKDAVGYIANELLENCMKYSHASKQHLVSIEMFLEPGAITLYTSNGIEPSFAHHYSRNVIRAGKKSKEKVDVYSFELLAYREMVNPNAMPYSDDPSQKLPDYFATSAARADEPTVVAVIPLAADRDLAIYGKPVADAIARRLQGIAGIEVESLSLSGAVPARVGLVIDGRIVEAGRGPVKLEARVRDPGRGIATAEVVTAPRPLAEIDEAAVELADALAPRLTAAIAAQRDVAAAERRRDPVGLTVGPARPADRPLAPRAEVDRRPVMVVVDAVGKAGGVPAHGIVTRVGYWLAERLRRPRNRP